MLIYESEENQISHKELHIPWKKIFLSVPIWGVLFGHIGSYFGLAILMTEFPSYLNSILHFSVEVSGLITGLPNVFEAVGGMMSSYVADRLIESKRLSVTAVRKIFNSIAMIGSGVCLLAITASGCEPTLIIVLYSILLYVNGFKYSGYNVTHVDMCPPLAGVLYGMTNCIASMGGIVVPNMVGAFTADGVTMANWNKVFYVTAGVYIITAIIYDLFASAELQQWDSEKETEKEKNCAEEKASIQTLTRCL
ncbi:putative inorganic phosphate cotransporter [Caerostris extrusa]|uniref:Inorganic phosphate cotransporter n=1 Tax=Caerostris extrusa TaxID=172846 RepID=A0AAV4Q2N6_CAEEX|nr:putative inorganic phosphate cotransporter [Caerostris extrusa]